MLDNIRGKGTAVMTGELVNWSVQHIYPTEDKWFAVATSVSWVDAYVDLVFKFIAAKNMVRVVLPVGMRQVNL
jgi:hypothetical protein